ncbi:MAG: PAS domain-containing sensor histidine kinase [Melioribacteraceae bacterium]
MNKSSKGQSSELVYLSEKLLKQEKQIKELTASVKKYMDLFDNSNSAIFILDRKGKVHEVNKVVFEKYGYSSKDFSTTSFFEITAESDRDNLITHFQNISNGNPSIIETTHIAKNNTLIPVELFLKILNYKSSEYILVIARDISNRRKYQAQLENERDLLEALMDNIPDTIYFKDTNSKFIRINKAQAELLGSPTCTYAIGKTDFDFFTSKNANDAFNDEKKLFKSKKSLISKTEHIKLSSGKYKWVSATKVPILDKNGNITGLVGISRDITDLKIAQSKILKFAKELQYINAAKDKFFSILAHDLKNPFFSLLGFVELLKNNFYEITDEEKLELIINIFKISSNSFQLLENLLDWANTQTGRIEYRPQKIDLKILLDDSCKFFDPIAQKKNITIKSNVKNSVTVYADADMMRTIISNLITNAIKFSNAGGKVQIDSTDESTNYKIVISDSGIGMDAETLKRLFCIDANHKSIGTSKEEGTGLGLIICKEFVEKNGGHICVESKVGKGSKFSFTIPKYS